MYIGYTRHAALQPYTTDIMAHCHVGANGLGVFQRLINSTYLEIHPNDYDYWGIILGMREA